MDVLFQSFDFKRPDPVNLYEKDVDLFANQINFSRSVHYETLHQVTVNHELFVKRKFKIQPISFGDKWQNEVYNRVPYLVKNGLKDLLRKSVRINKVLWILDQFSTGGYYHWITEILPRLWIANEKVKLASDIPLYFPGYFFKKWPFGHDLLKPFGRDYKLFSPHHLLKVDNLHFISQPGGPLAFQPQPIKASTQALLNYYYKKDYPYKFDKIYVSRNKSGKRLLFYENAILPYLNQRGYKILYSEELTIHDQVNIFSRAKILVSVHGAGLSNMVFMDQESSILEIRNPFNDHMNHCFLALADTFGHHYHYLIGNPIKQPNELRPIDYSLKFDEEDFKKSIENLDFNF